MEYILLLVNRLSGGSTNIFMSQDGKMKVIFVAVAIILVAILFMARRKN